jgi:hypothetical protein
MLSGFTVKDRKTQVKAFVHIVAGCRGPSTVARCDVRIATNAVPRATRHDGDEPPCVDLSL